MTIRSKLSKFILLGVTLAATGCALALVTSTPGEAKNRPTVSSADECWEDPGADTSGYEDGTITSCCYDDGCWICNENGEDCEWDGKYRTVKGTGGLTPVPVGGVRGGIPPKGTGGLTPAPGGGIVNPGHGNPPKGTGGLTPVPGGGVFNPGRGNPPKGKGGIAPVPVVGIKPPGGGGQPVTIFASGRGRGGRFGINPVQVVGTKQPGGSGQPVTIFARVGGHPGGR